MSACPNLIECCPPPVFPVEQNNIVAALGGLLWKLPCGTHNNIFECDSVNPPDQVAQLKGNFGQTYLVTVLLRGVCELANYIGGAVVPGTSGLMKLGGVYDNAGGLAGHNLYSLTVSNPSATYFLNQWDGLLNPNPCYVLRYSASVQMKTGATITLHCDGVNGGEVTNLGGLIVTPLPGEPPVNPTVSQPFDGQFLQLDVTAIA